MNYSLHNEQKEVVDLKPNEEFKSYLNNSKNHQFILDLSNATLLEVIDELIKVKQKLSPKYGRGWNTLKMHIRKIQELYGCVLMPIQITDIFYLHFCAYLINNNFCISSVKTLVSQMKTALEFGSRHHAVISPSYDQITLPTYKSQQIALTLDDVSRIYHFDLSTIDKRRQYIRHLDSIRDMFVLSCNLGQRYSDMIRFDKYSFKFNQFRIVQQKTGTTAVVDIDKFCIDRKMVYNILEKYNYNPPFSGDISSYNKYLKQLLQYVGLTEEIKIESKVSGAIKTKMVKKYKMIASHTGRRTFVTVNLMRGIPIHEIMRASGHTSYSSFQKYWCYYDE